MSTPAVTVGSRSMGGSKRKLVGDNGIYLLMHGVNYATFYEYIVYVLQYLPVVSQSAVRDFKKASMSSLCRVVHHPNNIKTDLQSAREYQHRDPHIVFI